MENEQEEKEVKKKNGKIWGDPIVEVDW